MSISIGVLRCDEVNACWRDEFGELDEMMQNALTEVGEDITKDWRFYAYNVHKNELPEDVHQHDAYIITGSRYCTTDDLPWMGNLYSFIVRMNKEKKTFIGVSFGHHAVATALGGKVERNDCGWLVGVHKLSVNQELLGLKDIPKKDISLILMNQDIVETPPKGAKTVAKSAKCKHAIIRYGEHGLTLEGHPEFSVKFAEKILSLAKEQMPSVRYEAGVISLHEKQPEQERVFNWFIRLIQKSVVTSENIDDVVTVS